jgi:hypothetical protein
VRRRLFAIVTLLAFAVVGPVMPSPSFARQEDFSAEAVATAIESAALPAGDPFWIGPVSKGKTDKAIGMVAAYEITTADGVVVYDIYPDAATAAANLATEGATPIPLDDAQIIGFDDPASPAAVLRQQQATAILGIDLWTLDTGNGAAACGQLRNVNVCAVTPGSNSLSADSPAVTGAVNGLALLAMLAPPPSTAAAPPPADAAQPADGADPAKGKKNKKGETPADPPSEQVPEPVPTEQIPAEQPPVEAPAVPAEPAAPAEPAIGGISGAIIPQFAVPGGLNAPGPIPYGLTAAHPIDLDAIGNGTVQAVAGYTVDEVYFILAHPKFLDGVPYAKVKEALTLRGSSLVTRYEDPAAMATKLKDLGWIDGYQRIFSLGWPPATVPGYVDITVSRFRDAQASVGALDALAGQMIADGGMLQVAWGPYADKAVGFTGSDVNGMQRVGFVAAGPYLITVTAVAPQGDPQPTVDAIVKFILLTVSTPAQ